MDYKRIVWTVIGVLLMAAAAQTQESVFPDKRLEDAVRSQVYDKRNTKKPLTREDAGKVWVLKAGNLGIEDLTGLEYCENLGEVDLSGNRIRDIAPLKNLKRIQSLDLSGNRIEDIGPLGGLESLQFLELSGNRVVDLSPLARVETLNSLYLGGNRIADLSPLASLKRLWSLHSEGNPLEKVGAIGKLPRLSTLDLRGCGLKEIAFLNGIRGVRTLMLEDNALEDLAPLVEAVRKDHEGERRFAPFLEVYLKGNPLSGRARSEQVEDLRRGGVRVHLSGDHS